MERFIEGHPILGINASKTILLRELTTMTIVDSKIRRFICFCVFNLMMSATICNAYSLGPWVGTFPEGVPANSAEYPPFSITTDSLVTLNVVAALTLDSQFAFIEINDSAGNRVAYNLLMNLPVTFRKPLAPGEYSVKIATGLGTVYGYYSITGTVEPTNITTTESEINDTTATPTTISGDGFGGSLGHWWDQYDVDTVDYFTYDVLKDGTLEIDTIIDSTLKSYSAGLSVRGAENQSMFSSSFSTESFSTIAYLTPGTYFIKTSIGLNNLWGAYSSTLTFTPAVENSSEIENNDTMATATPVTTKVFYGSYGYLRPEGSGDYTDYFAMDVQSPGNITLTVTIDDTLKGYYTAVHLYDSVGTTVTYKSLSQNEVTISEEGLAPGLYYLRFSQSLHSYRGGYKVESTGLNLPKPPEPSEVALISPSETIIDLTPTFTWNKDVYATWYKLFVGDSSEEKIHVQWYDAADICSGINCSVTLQTELSSGSYGWWVKSWNEAGSMWSDGMAFTIQGNDAPPSKVTHTSPLGAVQESTPTFTWAADPTSTWYKFWVGYNSTDKIFADWYDASEICSGGNCSVTLEIELMDGDYEWYIKSWNDYGKVWSDGMSFSIAE